MIVNFGFSVCLLFWLFFLFFYVVGVYGFDLGGALFVCLFLFLVVFVCLMVGFFNWGDLGVCVCVCVCVLCVCFEVSTTVILFFEMFVNVLLV